LAGAKKGDTLLSEPGSKKKAGREKANTVWGVTIAKTGKKASGPENTVKRHKKTPT